VSAKQPPEFYVSVLRIYVNPTLPKPPKVCSDVTVIYVCNQTFLKLSYLPIEAAPFLCFVSVVRVSVV